MGRLTFDVLDSWQEWDMHRNPWERFPDIDDAPPDNRELCPHDLKEGDCEVCFQAIHARRMDEVLALLRTLRREESERRREPAR